MSSLVRVGSLWVKYRLANTPREKEMLSQQSAATDESIDQLVYELYGLSEEEIKIVDGKEYPLVLSLDGVTKFIERVTMSNTILYTLSTYLPV